MSDAMMQMRSKVKNLLIFLVTKSRAVTLPLPECRQVILPCYLCVFSGSYSSYLLFLASLMSRCLCPILYACLPCSPDIATPPHPINLLFVYLVSLASRSACLGALLESCISLFSLVGNMIARLN